MNGIAACLEYITSSCMTPTFPIFYWAQFNSDLLSLFEDSYMDMNLTNIFLI